MVIPFLQFLFNLSFSADIISGFLFTLTASCLAIKYHVWPSFVTPYAETLIMRYVYSGFYDQLLLLSSVDCTRSVGPFLIELSLVSSMDSDQKAFVSKFISTGGSIWDLEKHHQKSLCPILRCH